MNKQTFNINNLRVASPCPMSWENMTGDERVRLCHSCKLNIYNIAEMTKPEVEKLIATHESRLCIRLFIRADRKVLTKDCPVGFRAYQKRIARFAGTTLAAILSLFSVSFGQNDNEIKVDASQVKIIRKENQTQGSFLYGKVTDTAGGIIPNAKIKLVGNKKEVLKKSNSDKKGNYDFSKLSRGIYKLEVTFEDFKTLIVENIEIKNNEKILFDISLEPSDVTETVGLYADQPLVDSPKTEIQTTISPQPIKSKPDQ